MFRSWSGVSLEHLIVRLFDSRARVRPKGVCCRQAFPTPAPVCVRRAWRQWHCRVVASTWLLYTELRQAQLAYSSCGRGAQRCGGDARRFTRSESLPRGRLQVRRRPRQSWIRCGDVFRDRATATGIRVGLWVGAAAEATGGSLEAGHRGEEGGQGRRSLLG